MLLNKTFPSCLLTQVSSWTCSSACVSVWWDRKDVRGCSSCYMMLNAQLILRIGESIVTKSERTLLFQMWCPRRQGSVFRYIQWDTVLFLSWTEKPVPVSVTGVRYNSLLWVWILKHSDLTWPDTVLLATVVKSKDISMVGTEFASRYWLQTRDVIAHV